MYMILELSARAMRALLFEQSNISNHKTPKVVSSVGLGATGGTRRWGVRTPTGADFPRLWKKTPLAVLLMTWAVLSAWTRPGG